jgi:hypothetical protein
VPSLNGVKPAAAMANEKFEMIYGKLFSDFERLAWHLDLEALMVY